jgi:hypothetical protein
VSAAWDAVARPERVGALILVAGLVLMAAPLVQLPKRFDRSWWTDPMQAPDLLTIALVLLASSAVLVGGLGWFIAQQAPLIEDGQLADADLKPTTLHRVPWLGAALALVGGVGVVACWVGVHGEVPVAIGPFGLGVQTEFVETTLRGQPLKLMLPRRVEVTSLSAGEAPQVALRFMRPKQTDAQPQALAAGESIDVESMRFTFLGVAEDGQALRAVLGGTTEQSIEAAGRKGQKVRVSLDGPEYTIHEISVNYMGAMGPAVQVESEAEGRFWLFQRASKDGKDMFGRSLRLIRLETQPAAILATVPARPLWPMATSVILLAAGIGLLLGAPELRRSAAGRGFASLNAAGELAAEADAQQVAT